MSLVHAASCVAIGGRAILIEGPSGSGKSTLALALIDRGATLVGDDGVTLERRADRLYASPPPRITGLLEVRNLGLLPFPTTQDVPAALVLRLDRDAPRFIQAADHCTLGGVTLPLLRLWPGGAELALKAQLALERYGLA
ncbi:HPr kinase/phosphorylase [Novosphingobium sp. B 225]|uniref:HPr kinase/phosphorylase n=1 Tax=Novosphingobium sp. B 225 TaxID=1961849 RepID=UPI000B4BBCAE|nr:HPr kinase/phosphatase C-terminal domain-containing protein [Novosphingobium sp. B 225]